MKRQLFLAILVCTFPVLLTAQAITIDFYQLDSIQKTEERNTVVFIYTDWCKYCQQMKNTTFKNDSVINLLNKQFYFVTFNAETKEDITYNKHKFRYKPIGNNTGIHELAEQLGTVNGKLNYPTLCILNKKNEIIFQYGGFISSEEFIEVLKASH